MGFFLSECRMFSAGQLSIFPPICFNFAERFFYLNKSVCNGIELKNWITK